MTQRIRHFGSAATPILAASASSAVEIPPDAKWFATSAQSGKHLDGSVPADIEAQTGTIWMRIEALLQSADLAIADIVHVTALLIERDDIPAFIDTTREHLGDVRPTMTLLLVDGVGRSDLLVEVDVTAAR